MGVDFNSKKSSVDKIPIKPSTLLLKDKSALVYISGSVIPSRTANSVQVMKMCEAFANLGYKVTLVARKKGLDIGAEEIHDFYGVNRNFTIHFTLSKGIDLFGVDHTLKSLFYAINKKPDMIYGRHIPTCFALGLLGRRPGLEIHELNWAKNPLTKAVFRLAICRKWFPFVVTISGALRKDVEDIVSPCRANFLVAHDGVSEEVHEPWVSHANKKPSVAYVGSLYQGRGIELIISLAQHFKDIEFHIVGGEEDSINSAKKLAGEADNIVFHGFVPPTSARKYLASCDVALAPYQKSLSVHGGGGDTSKWMSPLKIFEYMSSGKAILCSDIPVLREVLEHDVTALLVPPDDFCAWRDSLSKLLCDASLRERLGKAAKTEAKKYTWTSRADAISKLFSNNSG